MKVSLGDADPGSGPKANRQECVRKDGRCADDRAHQIKQ